MPVSRLDHSESTIQKAVTDRFIAIAPDSDLAALSTQRNNWLQLQAHRSPLQQLTAALKAKRDQGQPIQELHLIAHANSSGIQIGSTTLNTAALRSHAPDLASWKIKTLVLWSCQLALNKDFIALLEELTGAEVFASNDSINRYQLTTQSCQGNQRSLDELIDHKTLSNWQGSLSSSFFTQLGSDIDGEAADDYSGISVSLSDDGKTVAIGAYGNSGSSGHTRIYQYSSGTWSQLGSDIDGEATGDNSGYSVSLSDDGTTVAVGAFRNDANTGHARVFSLPSSSSSSSGGGESGNGRTSESIENTIINGRRFWTHNVEVLREQSDINYGLLNNNDFLEVVGGINNFANGNNGDDHIILRGGKGRYLGGADNDRIEVFNTAIGSWVNGNFGADLITGSAGGVTYRGGPGNDIFAVSAGDIWGDKDADTFQATAGAEFATIHDFTVGLDRIKGVEGGSFSLTNQGVLYSLGDDQMLLLKGITDVSQVTVI